MRVLLDTNVVLDVLLNRQPWVNDAAAVWQANDDGRVIVYLAASTFTDIFYIARKAAGVSAARQAIRTCLEAFEICEVTRHTLQQAESLSGSDFEDNLQIACATLQNMDAIITRDKAGFQNLNISVFAPAEFLTQL
jgi:predicted nucleic acid-binding protein